MGLSPRERLRLGRIGFLNVLPIYYPLESGIVPHPFDIISGTPAYLNGLMSKGELDLSVVSSIEYARHPKRYFIIPDLSISCRGAVKSVLLLSRVPLKKLEGRSVLVSTQSHTSVALLEILFTYHLGIKVKFRPGMGTDALERGERPAAFLTIGDEALRLRGHDLYPHRLDLGQAWQNWTGLPFVFALWVIQRKTVETWNGRLGGMIETLVTAKRWGRSNMGGICSEASKRGLLSPQDLQEYYECLVYDLDREERKGLELFYHCLQDIGAISQAPRLDILSPLASVA